MHPEQIDDSTAACLSHLGQRACPIRKHDILRLLPERIPPELHVGTFGDSRIKCSPSYEPIGMSTELLCGVCPG
jgi:hypothetical protein